MGTNARVSDSAALGLHPERDGIVMDASVDAAYDDGVVCLRLAEDCIVLVDAIGAFPVGKVLRILLPPGSLSVTVTGG